MSDPRCEAVAPAARHAAFAIFSHADILQLGRLVHALTAADGGAAFTTALTGADDPARPLAELREALERSGDGLLAHHRALDPEDSEWPQHEARQRYLYRWRPLRLLGPAASPRWHWVHGLNYLQPFVRLNVAYGPLRLGTWRGTLPAGLSCYGGCAYTSLSRRAVRYLLEVQRTRPDVIEWARTSLAIDESFIHTVLVSAGTFEFVNDSGQYIDWSAASLGHPRVLTLQDATRIEESGAFFARKVDSRASAELLDHLDARRARRAPT